MSTLPHQSHDERRPRRTHRSVLVYLVALALIPALGMPAFAGLFATGHLADASAARAIGGGMQQVKQIDDLRSAISREATATALASLAVRYGLTTEQMTEIVGEDTMIPLDEARAGADDAVAAVGTDSGTQPSFAALEADLGEARRLADDATSSVTPANADDGRTWQIYWRFMDLQESADALQRLAVRAVMTGQHGPASAELLTAASQVEAVAAIASATYQKGSLIEGLAHAPTQAERAQVQDLLRAAIVRFADENSTLRRRVSDELWSSWHALETGEESTTFSVVVEQMAHADLQEPISPTTEGLADFSGTALVFTGGVRDVVAQAVDQGVAIARADQRAAEGRARSALVWTAVLLVATATCVVVVGGTMRRRLDGLAGAAERLRAGQLEVMEVTGPREIAVASEALNDAVRNFRRVALHAEILASGDLDDPNLAQPAPGALGASVHASVKRIVAAVREGEQLREQLAHQAAHDALTALPNRTEAERLLTRSLARATRAGTRVAVLFVDLDHFKACNDTFGHAAGDHVLQTVSARMTATVRPGDTVCRLGGDEFVIIVEPVEADRAVVDIAERVVATLAQPITFDEHTIGIGGTVGVAVSGPASEAAELLHAADSAMYRAKQNGRSGVEVFDERLRAEVERDDAFRAAMAQAIAQDELVLHYQPVIDIVSGRLQCLEALACWNHPTAGLLEPDEFIDHAERAGFIADIGRWALRAATSQLVTWSADPAYEAVDVAVNISGKHLREGTVVDDVRNALAASGLDPRRLLIEITESMAVDDIATVEHLHQLAALGVRIALDDFGATSTSFSQLLHLPIHVLKIDHSFFSGTRVDRRAGSDGPARLIDLIIEIGRSLDLGVVAGGVEDPTRLAALRDTDCDSAQGFVFSRPLPADEIPDWVERHAAGEHPFAGPSAVERI